jgi:sortase (surface protein transpeptidase)
MYILAKSIPVTSLVLLVIITTVALLLTQPQNISVSALPNGVVAKNLGLEERQTSQVPTNAKENIQSLQESVSATVSIGSPDERQTTRLESPITSPYNILSRNSSEAIVSKIPSGFSDYLPPASEELPPLPGLVPHTLRIPSLGITANVEKVGLDRKGRMDVPQNIWNVAWFKLGPQPGERGNVAIAGHVDGPNTPAVFWDLKKIELGSRIYIQDAKGSQKIFEVLEKTVYTVEAVPLDRIFGRSAFPNLNLITCAGTFLPEQGDYDKRLIVYARLLEPKN